MGPFPPSFPHYMGDYGRRWETIGNTKSPKDSLSHCLLQRCETTRNEGMAEGMGFEPTIGL